ncbi:DNA-binding transcriptional regulator, MerR family [Gracilibacillus ureilyticus]|uniref:DNA-binding transcriptional regulator, MerR family n=1 Tax=Gracilibacillus ureilyticus TaxID=531814 RepID=A0A1H9MQV6_9BACI|nr:MerR family transcriptional regulator [Gracilibacillus ureilyticus]SER25523.1 DNA-binding transcriptional regulator, MerR family [Gracilibacillus ureilyticus]
MEEKLYTVKAFATLTGVTERTLRYYDRMGLLIPSHYNEKGHRLYGSEEIHKIQKILTLKYLGCSLTEIKESLIETKENRLKDTLNQQKEMLEKKRKEIEFVIQSIDKVEKLVGNNEVNDDLLLALIYSIQHEEAHREYLSKFFSESFVHKVFMEHMPLEERDELESQLIEDLKKLQELHANGFQPEDQEVQAVTNQIYDRLSDLMSPNFQKEFDNLKDFDEDAFIFSYLPKDVELFIEKAFDITIEQSQEDTADDSDSSKIN